MTNLRILAPYGYPIELYAIEDMSFAKRVAWATVTVAKDEGQVKKWVTKNPRGWCYNSASYGPHATLAFKR